MKLIRLSLFVLFAVTCSFAHTNKAEATKHTIKAAARPFKAVGHYGKAVAKDTAVLSVEAVDAAIVDPLGVYLQGVADFTDMFIAAPLEALPAPLSEIGVGVHEVYLGIDAAGQFLAK